MKLLAIESCFQSTSVCLYVDGKMTEEVHSTPRMQAEQLPIIVQKLLDGNCLKVKDLSGIIINHGPGAFTGLRIGIAFAQGLVAPFQIPLYGISSLECYIVKNPEQNIAIAIKALKGHVYYQEFNANGIFIEDVKHIPIASIPTNVCIISVGISISGEMQHFEEMPIASQLIQRFFFKKPPVFCEPLYVRPINAVIPKNMKKIK